MKGAINYKLINIALFLLVIFLLGRTYYVWRDLFKLIFKVLNPFLIALALTYFLHPIVNLLSKKINKNISSIIVLSAFIFIFYLLIKFTVPVLYKEMFVILKEIKYFLLNLRYKGIFSFLYEHIDSFSIKIINYIQNNIFLFLSKSINIISSLITILVLTLCFLLNYDKFFSFIKSFLIKKKPRLYFLLVNINRELSSYITGIGIIMIVEIIEYTIIYRIIGHTNYLLLAALTSLTTIIPFVGGLISNIIAIITASVVSKRVFILTSIVVILMPIIDSYLIQPRIYKKTNQIPTFLSIVIVIVGGLIFKVVGIMIAIPLYIIIKNILKLTFLDKYDIM